MPKAAMVFLHTVTVVTARFAPFSGSNSGSATELNAQLAATEDMTFSNLRQQVRSGGDGDNTIKFRDAGADGQQVCTITGVGVVEDTTHTDVLTTGDLYCFGTTDTGTDPLHSWIVVNVELASGYGRMHTAANVTGAVCDVASSTRFIALDGILSGDFAATEAPTQVCNRAYSELAAMQVRVLANARTNNSVFKNRINGGDGTGICTFGAGVTGLIQDTAVNDALATGDLINFSCALLTGVEDLTMGMVSGTYKSGTQEAEYIIADDGGGARTASATPDFGPLGGNIQAIPGLGYTDATTRMKLGFAGVARNLRCYISANTYTGDGTLKLYKNGSAVISLTITAGATGQIENTTDTVSFVATDEFSFELVGGTSGSITINHCAITASNADAAAALIQRDMAGGLGSLSGGLLQ